MIPGDQKQTLPLFMPTMPSIVQRPVNTNALNSDATLYIGNLHPEVTDMELFNYFRPYGDILSCRIMKDIYSGESRGFAFLSFKAKEDAKSAKEALNYQKIHGWEIRISFKKSPGEFDPKANIFVKNVARDVTTKQLDELCQQFGNVLCCAIRNDENGQSLGYGYVQYENEEAASRAVKALEGVEKWGSPLQVQFFVPSKSRQLEQKNLYIKNFPKTWSREQVDKFIDELRTKGTVTCAGVYENKPDANTVRYYAFLAYENEDDSKKVTEEYNNKKMEGHAEGDEEDEKLMVTIALPKRLRKEQLKKKHLTQNNLTNLFVKSLKMSVTEDELRAAFSKYGKITSLALRESKPVAHGPTEPLKFGFVNFSDEKEASDAFFKGKKDADIRALLHESHPSTAEFICYAQPKAIRNQYLRMKKNMMKFMPRPMPMMMPQQHKRGMGNFMKGRRPQHIGDMPLLPMTMIDPSNISLIQPIDSFGTSAFHIQSPSNPISTPSSMSRQNERKEPQYDVNWLKHNKKEFMNFDTDKQRNVLGELMFAKIQNTKLVSPDNVSKVTGMLIDLEILDYEEIIDMLENSDSLKERINEALEVINDSD